MRCPSCVVNRRLLSPFLDRTDKVCFREDHFSSSKNLSSQRTCGLTALSHLPPHQWPDSGLVEVVAIAVSPSSGGSVGSSLKFFRSSSLICEQGAV